MRVAQGLYEAGAITYMRTDGVQMDPGAVSEARAEITRRFSGHYCPEKPRHYEAKAKNAQEAHEAIRPTQFSRDKFGHGDEARLYELIWKRAVASQMANAQLERTSVALVDGTALTELRATGQVVKFPGFLAVYEEGRDAPSDKAGSGTEDDDAGLLPAMATGDMARQAGGRGNAAFPPNRRRVFPKRRWSSGWRNWGSGARRPMRRRCR